jgi:hypothetical protein
MYALANNFQTVPIHSDAGNLNSTIFQGYDPNMCPIIGEIQMYELSNKTGATNSTFEQHTSTLYALFKSKGLLNLPQDAQGMNLEDFKAVIQEVWQNGLEQRYTNIVFSSEE